MLYATNFNGGTPGSSGNKSGAHAISLQPIAFNHDTCAYESDYASKSQGDTQSDSEQHTETKGGSENV